MNSPPKSFTTQDGCLEQKARLQKDLLKLKNNLECAQARLRCINPKLDELKRELTDKVDDLFDQIPDELEDKAQIRPLQIQAAMRLLEQKIELYDKDKKLIEIDLHQALKSIADVEEILRIISRQE
jgi:hypothetical protein